MQDYDLDKTNYNNSEYVFSWNENDSTLDRTFKCEQCKHTFMAKDFDEYDCTNDNCSKCGYSRSPCRRAHP